jgi:membrane associated rhomboid family serine protease
MIFLWVFGDDIERVLGRLRYLAFYLLSGLFVILQLWNLGKASQSEVAYWCHFGGMLAGGILFPLMKPPGLKLFQCLRPVPVTVVQIGRRPPARASGVDSLR